MGNRYLSRLTRVLAFIVAVELAYLVLVNLALRLPLTQVLVNEIRPDKFHVSWERAWSWYPFRVHAEGIAASGQSRNQQWQISSPAASGSIALLPLLFKRVWLRDVAAIDVDYRQRPRLQPGRDYSRLLPHFPEIEGRALVPAETRPLKKRRPWHLAIDGMRVEGDHRLWIYQARGSVSGAGVADLRYRSRGGAFSLATRDLDLRVERIVLDDEREVLGGGKLRGSVGFAPFVPRENKGLSLLGFLRVAVDLELEADSLAFINLFTSGFEGLSVDGRGQIEGSLHYDRGTVLGGTDLVVDADDLQVQLLEHRIEGEGVVTLALGEATAGRLNLDFEYRDLLVFQAQESRPVLSGQNLELRVGGDGFVLPRGRDPDRDRFFGFEVGGLRVPDLAMLQRYLPAKWPFRLHGGGGQIQGSARLTPTSLVLDLNLDSDDARVAIGEYRFDSDLDLTLKLANPSVMSNQTSVAGSYLELSNARLQKADGDDAEVWNGALRIEGGQFGLIDEAAKKQEEDVIDLLQLLAGSSARDLVAQATGAMDVSAEVSRLDWLGVLLEGKLGTAVRGSGSLGGVVHLAGGLPAAGTDVLVRSPDLVVNVLDYRSSGQGAIRLRVSEGEDLPVWHFDLQLQNADLKRGQEEVAVIEDVAIGLSALLAGVSLSGRQPPYTLNFDIHSATVTDMTVFNDYLPVDAPLQLRGGTAALTAAIELQADDADGWLRLQAAGVEAEIGAQSIQGDLEANILLAGGLPSEMRFDIAGSELLLDRVTVSGEQAQFSGDYWSGQLRVSEGRTQWRKPLQMDARVHVLMSDSRPFVALFDNLQRRPPFLGEMLTVKTIVGEARVEAADDVIVIADAHATSDHIELGARGSFSPSYRDGVFYLRYRKANALLQIDGDNKRVHVLDAREKYQAYRPRSGRVHSAR